MKRPNLIAGCTLFFLSAATTRAAAGDGASYGIDSTVLIGVAVMLILAKIGGELFERMGQPAVLGELVAGIVLGNLWLVGFNGLERLKTNGTIAGLAELGVIILLFQVGLESDLKDLMEVGLSAMFVAVLGVIAPFLLGTLLSFFLFFGAFPLLHVFIGAILCATSVGITARVFKDLGKLHTREARIILGAAVIDDVLGLLILAIVAGMVKAVASGHGLSLFQISMIGLVSFSFLVGSIAIGHLLMPRILRGAGRLEMRGVLLTLAISFCMVLAWAAAKVGLAPIVGAFAAGLILDEVHYKPKGGRTERSLNDLLQPVSQVLVPIFFVWMGSKVDLQFFARIDLIGFALLLTLVAIIGKQICALGVAERGLNRLAIGIGMIPRGEVGLIFAAVGTTLILPSTDPQGEPLIGSGIFDAVVIMVFITTLITPLALKWALARKRKSKGEDLNHGDEEGSA